MVEHFYCSENGVEYCFNIEVNESLTLQEIKTLTWLLSETFNREELGKDQFGNGSFLKQTPGKLIIETGPLLNYTTPWNTNALSICHACGLTKITRLERSIRRIIPTRFGHEPIIRSHDRRDLSGIAKII